MNLTNGKVYLVDRSGAELADRCGMAYWWNRKHGGTGVVMPKEAEALMVGRQTHEDLQAVAEAEDISPAGLEGLIEPLLANLQPGDEGHQVVMELLYRRLGWLVAYALYIEPKVREVYETVGLEKELILDRSPLWVPVTPDRVLKHRRSGHVVYREYKSTISSSGKWLGSWKKMVQLHLGIKAIEEDTGQPVAYGQVMGLMKGMVRDGRLAHPYVWGYCNQSTGAWTHDYQQARSGAWSPRPVWEYPGGIIGWVTACGPDVALSQFPHTEPVFLNEKLLGEWVARWQAKLAQWGTVEEMCANDPKARAIFFEPRTSQCEPPFGDPCPYRLACWNASVNADPIGSGHYVERQPHHEVEVMLSGRK